METKPNGSGAYRGASQLGRPDKKARKSSGETGGTPNPSEILTPGQTLFAQVASRFERADLSNPDKLACMVSSAVHLLLAQEFKGLPPAQRRRLAAWMNKDPLIRERMVKAFEKLLS
jgi:hypothetical protein